MHAAGSLPCVAAEQQRVDRFPSPHTHTWRHLAALGAPEAPPRQHPSHTTPCGEHFGCYYSGVVETLEAVTPRQQAAGAAPCEASVGSMAHAGDLPRQPFPSSWRRELNPVLKPGMRKCLDAAQWPAQAVRFRMPPLVLPSHPRCDSRTLFPVCGPGSNPEPARLEGLTSDPDPARLEGLTSHAGHALVHADGAPEASDADALARSVPQQLDRAERPALQEPADLELCALLNPSPSPQMAHTAAMRPASAPACGSPRRTRSNNDNRVESQGAQAVASLQPTQRVPEPNWHAEAAPAVFKDPEAGAGPHAGDTFASGEHAEAAAQCAPGRNPAPDPGPAWPDASSTIVQDIVLGMPCAPAASPSQGFNSSQEGALDALVAQLVAQPALLRQLLTRLLLSPGACMQLGQAVPAPEDERIGPSVGTCVLPSQAIHLHEMDERSLLALAEPAQDNARYPQERKACSAPETMLTADAAVVDAPESGSAGAAEQSSACSAVGGSLHGAPAAGPGSPSRARSHARARSSALPLAAHGTHAGRAVHMTQIPRHPVMNAHPRSGRPPSSQRGARAPGARPHSASAMRSRATEQPRPSRDFSFSFTCARTGREGEVPGSAGSSHERGPASNEPQPAETPARGVTSPVDTWLAEDSAEAAPDTVASSHAGLPEELGNFATEHGDRQRSADADCEQAAGAAHSYRAPSAGDAALLGSPRRACAQGLGSGQVSLYAQPRAWDDRWQAGDDGAVPRGAQAPSSPAGSGSGAIHGIHDVVEGLGAKQLDTDRGHADSPAMHAVIAHTDDASNPGAAAFQFAAATGGTEPVIQLSETAGDACGGARRTGLGSSQTAPPWQDGLPLNPVDQQHEAEAAASIPTRSCGHAGACGESAPAAAPHVNAAGVGALESPALFSCISSACVLD